MLDAPGPPLIHNARGEAVSSEEGFSAAKYQKKRWLVPTSSQPVYWGTVVLQRVEFWGLMRMEWDGEVWLWKTVKSEAEEISGDECIGN